MKFLGLLLTAFLCLGQGQPAPDCSIAGRLTNLLTGAPARKGKIVLTRQGSDRFTRSAISDTNGRYILPALPPGQYRLSVQRDGFLPTTYGAKGPNRPGKVLVLAPGQKREDVNFALAPPAVITGRVLDEDAEPVTGVMVQALHEDFNRGVAQYLPVGSAATNDIGEYRLFGLPPGKFYLMSSQTPINPQASVNGQIYASVFYPATTDFGAAAPLNMAAGGEARDIDLHVVKTTSVALRGTVANLPAGGERSLQVQMSRKDRARVNFGSRSAGGFNANTGQFEFQGLTPGSYTISAWIRDSASKILWAQQEVEVGAVDLNDVRLTLGNGLEIPGAIRFDGDAPAGAGTFRVWLSRPEFSGPTPSAAAAADHSFVLNSVTPGTWMVEIAPVPPGGYIESIELGDKPGEQAGVTRPLTVSSELRGPLTIVLGMHGGTVTGTVRTAGEKPEAVESATVLLVPAREYRGVATYFKTAVSDSEGHYELRGIAPGTYRLLALEDMEPLAYQNPQFLNRLEGKGKEISMERDRKAAENLTIEPLP
jgi:hypothetical protein